MAWHILVVQSLAPSNPWCSVIAGDRICLFVNIARSEASPALQHKYVVLHPACSLSWLAMMKCSILRPGPGLLRHFQQIQQRHLLARCPPLQREFQTSRCCTAVRTQRLGDVGEGITECMLNMWFVEEGARVEEWDKLCEMQSDKAAVEISANYPGVIKKLYAQANDMVKTGAPLADIDDGLPEEEASGAEITNLSREKDTSSSTQDEQSELMTKRAPTADEGKLQSSLLAVAQTEEGKQQGHEFLATPAVRGLLKEHNIDISHLNGSGRDGRILKEDILAYLGNQNIAPSSPSPIYRAPLTNSKELETSRPLSPIETQMFRVMTASLSIPHFLYADEVNITHLSGLRSRLNHSREPGDPKLTLLPFILKAVSISLNQYPLLNARIDTATDPSRPQMIYRTSHNIGIAMDTAAGLLVPVVKNVGGLSISDIAQEIRRLSELAKAKKLSSADLSGGTITVSNIGSVGGTVVAPVIVEGQVAILGVGKSRAIPIFGKNDSIEKAEVTNFSWSADHRIVDGATMARMGSMVKQFIEEPDKLLVQMR
jgi:2-oxoisovalerate dehydrogenase E2 component (dihydrolipoyl transacylase)